MRRLGVSVNSDLFTASSQDRHDLFGPHCGRAFAGSHTFHHGTGRRYTALHRALPLALVAELRTGVSRHQQRGELPVSRGAARHDRCRGRGRSRSEPHDARYRLLLHSGDGGANPPCRMFCNRKDSEPTNTSKPDLAKPWRKVLVFAQSLELSFMPAIAVG